MIKKKILFFVALSFLLTQESHADSALKKLKSKVSAVKNMAKNSAKSMVNGVKTAVDKDRKSIKAVSKDIKQGHFKKAVKDSGKVVKNSLDVVKAVPLVGSIIKDGEESVKSAIAVGKDIKQIKQDSKTMGFKKALKKDGKKLAKDTWKTVESGTSAIGTPLMFASGVGIGAEGVALLGQSGFLTKGLSSVVKDTKTMVKDYKKDKGDPTVSKKHRIMDVVKNGLMVGGDVVGIASMSSIGLHSGLGRGALKELGVAGKELEGAKRLALLADKEQAALKTVGKKALSVVEQEEKATLMNQLSAKTVKALGDSKNEKVVGTLVKRAKIGEKIGGNTNVLFGTQFASQDISANIGNVQMLSADKKQLKQDKAELSRLIATGASKADIDAYKNYVQQDKDYVNRDKAGFAGTTLKVIGDTQQNNIGLQSALLMSGSAVSDSAATYQAKRDLKKAQKNGASADEIKKLKEAYAANQKIMLGDTVGSLFHQNMAITMSAQEVGGKISESGYKKLDDIQKAQQQAASQ